MRERGRTDNRERWAELLKAAEPRYGIVANVVGPDRFMRTDALAWIVGGTGGEGMERFIWRALSHSGRPVSAWKSIKKFRNFRAKWIPPDVPVRHMTGTREEMEAVAAELEISAESMRQAFPVTRSVPHG